MRSPEASRPERIRPSVLPGSSEEPSSGRRRDLTATLPLRTLVRDTALGLEIVGTADISQRPITWVYVSELPNPGPWLDGGELVLTLGLWLRDGSTTADQYVQRLVAAGAAALAMLAGPPGPDLDTYQEIPAELITAANTHGLPLLRVPGEVTFLTVTKTVAYALASHSLARLSEALDAQDLLSRDAVGRGGLRGMTTRLASLLDAWVLVVGPDGDILDSTPDLPVSRVPGLLQDIRSASIPQAADVIPLLSPNESVLAYRLWVGDRSCGHLIIGRPTPPSAAQRRVVNLASVVIALMLDRDEEGLLVSRRLQNRYAQALLHGDSRAAGQLAPIMAVTMPTGSVYVAATASRLPGTQPAERSWQELCNRLGDAIVAADSESHVAVLDAVAGVAFDLISPVTGQVPDLVIGLAGPVDADELATAHRSAVAALGDALKSGQQVVNVGRGSRRRLLDVIPPAEAHAFAEEFLRPLREYDRTHRGDLLATVRCWLENYGQWEPTSVAMGVHRHTLRNRIERVEEVLGTTLNSTATRTELWVALQLSDIAP